MAVNPMQRKARNSFLLGMVITMVIMGAIIAFLFIQLNSMKQEQEQTTKTVYVLNKDVQSGDTITMADLTTKDVTSDAVPVDFAGVNNITGETIARISLKSGTILTQSMLNTSGEKVTKDQRLQEYNMLTLPTQLVVGDYIDIRFMLPSGQDYVVLSKKKIQDANSTTIWINLTEEEILIMNSAIVESYVITASKLYVTTYSEPGNQEAAVPTYVPNSDVVALINDDSNIVNVVMSRYEDKYKARRNADINAALNQYASSELSSKEAKIQEEITKLQESRKQYLDSLNGAR